MNKNAYEVRLDVMKMAKEMLDKQYEVEYNKYLSKMDLVKKSSDTNGLVNFINAEAPQLYNANTIIEMSNQLYDFVGTKSNIEQKK